MSTLDVEKFYNKFSSRFIRDYIFGNIRVQRQMEFFKNAIPKDVENVLLIGCGSGQTAYYIAQRCAKKANILAVDISSEALRIANNIFRHDRVKYQNCNILSDSIDGEWHVIVFPDTYEHLPLESRKLLHSKISKLLYRRGRILITVPSPYHQEFLRREHPEELQVVDEIVELKDLMRLADDVSGVLSYLNMISVWRTNDYIHAMIERQIDQISRLNKENSLPIKASWKNNILSKGWSRFSHKTGLTKIFRWVRRIHVMHALKNK